jgi:hypothetical protein
MKGPGIEEQSAEENGIEIEADRSKAEEKKQATEQEKEVKQPNKNKAEPHVLTSVGLALFQRSKYNDK